VGILKFGKAYFEDGKDSNYYGYAEQVTPKTIVVANDLVKLFDLGGMFVLDYGCAMGILVSELRSYGVIAIGTDISDYALKEGHRILKNKGLIVHVDKFWDNFIRTTKFDYVLFLDVLEHMKEKSIRMLLLNLMANKLLVKIPICTKDGEDFVFDASRKDKTHITCRTKRWWKDLFKEYGYKKFTPIDTTYLFDSEGVLAGVFE